MCYDQEKTQGTETGDYERAERRLRDVAREANLKCNAEMAGMAVRPKIDAEILAELFTYHPPTPVTLPKFAAINQAAKNFAEIVLQNCVRGSDRAKAIEMIQDARMVANRSIAVNGLSIA